MVITQSLQTIGIFRIIFRFSLLSIFHFVNCLRSKHICYPLLQKYHFVCFFQFLKLGLVCFCILYIKTSIIQSTLPCNPGKLKKCKSLIPCSSSGIMIGFSKTSVGRQTSYFKHNNVSCFPSLIIFSSMFSKVLWTPSKSVSFKKVY